MLQPNDLYVLKKSVSAFLMPMPIIIFIMLVGLFRLWFTHKQISGKMLVTLGLVILVLLSNRLVVNHVVGFLESSNKPADLQLVNPSTDQQIFQDIKFVVVLGGGHHTVKSYPLTSQVSYSTLVRLIEGVSIYRKIPGARLVLSGGGVNSAISEAEQMQAIAEDIGIDREDIILESQSRDTEDEARLIRDIVGTAKFVLVTSAVHMQRSVSLFRKQGMDPLPAPAGHLSEPAEGGHLTGYIPDSSNLSKARSAAHEYLGIVWASLLGQI